MKRKNTSHHTHNHHKIGFTLIELLAVMVVFVSVGSIIMSILIGALRGNNKTNTLQSVQSNGNYAIVALGKAIRNASELRSPSSCGDFTAPTATDAVKLAFPDGSISTYSCKDATGKLTVASNSSALINTSAVTVTRCTFTCAQSSPTDYPIVGVDFSLKSTNTSNFIEQQASASAIEFQTSVVIRNLNR